MQCKNCGDEFDPRSPQKRKAGGFAFHCPMCSEERVVKYVGIQSGDGKQAQAAILSFNSNEDREKYMAYFQRSTGYHKGKVCHLSGALPTTPSVAFTTKQAIASLNHKGRA